MRTTCLVTILALAASPVLATNLFAATVEVVSGAASLNKGRGFEQITVINDAKPGDRIAIDANSVVNVVFESGCTITVKADDQRKFYRVPEQPECAGAPLAFTGPAVAPITGVVVAGAVVGGVIVAASSSGKPASP